MYYFLMNRFSTDPLHWWLWPPPQPRGRGPSSSRWCPPEKLPAPGMSPSHTSSSMTRFHLVSLLPWFDSQHFFLEITLVQLVQYYNITSTSYIKIKMTYICREFMETWHEKGHGERINHTPTQGAEVSWTHAPLLRIGVGGPMVNIMWLE